MSDIRRIEASKTWSIRQKILRPTLPIESSVYEGDEKTTTLHLGYYLEGTLVCIATFLKEPKAEFKSNCSYRLRGMATLEGHRKNGFGGEVLRLAFQILKNEYGADLLWCNARTPALHFYEDLGLKAVGSEFIIPEVGPHYLMWKFL